MTPPTPTPTPAPTLRNLRGVLRDNAKAAASTSPIRCALWSDGELHILRGDAEPILLTREETRELVRYLDSISLEGCA